MSNVLCSVGYSPSAPGYSPSSTSQYTPSNKDDQATKDDISSKDDRSKR